jgi:integrase
VKLDSITPEHVEKYKTSRLKENKLRGGRLKKGEGQEKRRTAHKLKPATVNRELACLKIIFNHFIRQDVVITNPVSRVKFPAENNEQMRVLAFEEQRSYLNAASQPLRDIAALMLETGMRPEEIYRIRKENVNLIEGWVFNPHGKTKAARRKIALTSNAAETLRFRLETAKGVYLFPHENDPDKPMLKANNAHYGALRRSGVKPFRLYDCRHTFASRAAMSGVDLVTLAALLGHSRIQMVMRYAHPTQEHQINAIKKLEEFTAMRMMETFAVGNPATLQ